MAGIWRGRWCCLQLTGCRVSGSHPELNGSPHTPLRADWCYVEAWGTEEGRRRAAAKPTAEDLARLREVSPIMHVHKVGKAGGPLGAGLAGWCDRARGGVAGVYGCLCGRGHCCHHCCCCGGGGAEIYFAPWCLRWTPCLPARPQVKQGPLLYMLGAHWCLR